jgi:hypothetical protein
VQEGRGTTFLDSAVIAAARTACRLNPAEIRDRRNKGPGHAVKLPVCESILTDRLERSEHTAEDGLPGLHVGFRAGREGI